MGDVKKLIANLEKNGFVVKYYDESKDASDYLNSVIDGTTVGFGGSKTLDAMGLKESLGAHNEIIWHWYPREGETPETERMAAKDTKIYLSSVNAIAETGEMVNIDGAFNRLASVFYGHDKVYLVIGTNKITEDYDSAVWRARNIASPLNCKRYNVSTPCVKDGRCHDCNSPERLCRGMSVIWKAPMRGEIEIILINNKLGF